MSLTCVLIGLPVVACGAVGTAATESAAAHQAIQPAIPARASSALPGAHALTASGAPRPAPAWIAHAIHRSDLLVHLDKHPTRHERQDADTRDRLLAALDRVLDAFLLDGEKPFRGQGQLVRSLSNGLMFHSRFAFEARPRGTSEHMESQLDVDLMLQVEPDHGERVTYRGRLADDGLRAIASSEDDLPLGFDGHELSPNLPVSLGDLPIGDLLGLRGALLDGNLTELGELAVGRSARLRVIDIRFPPWLLDAERPAGEDYTTRGASALLYVDHGSLLPRALRILDRGDRLVRVYDNLIYVDQLPELDPRALQLAGLQVHDATDGGHSTFRFDPE